jgi:hypothetical protein
MKQRWIVEVRFPSNDVGHYGPFESHLEAMKWAEAQVEVHPDDGWDVWRTRGLWDPSVDVNPLNGEEDPDWDAMGRMMGRNL